jgi:hypothetical protein
VHDFQLELRQPYLFIAIHGVPFDRGLLQVELTLLQLS